MSTSAPPDGLGLLRLGLVGVGRWGRVFINTIQQIEGVCLAGICSRNPASAGLVAPTCRICSDWRELVESVALDGLIVATPPALHAEPVEACFRAGLPVMVEKPLTLDVAQAEHLGRVAEETGTLILVDHTQLFHPGYVKLKELAKSLGPIRRLRSTGGNWGPFRPDTPVLWDYGPHDLAFCLDLLGAPPSSVQLLHHERRQLDAGLGENLGLSLAFPGGAHAEIHIGNMVQPKKRVLEVVFDNQTLVLDDLAPAKLQRVFNDKSEPIPYVDAKPLTRAVETFLRGIRGERDTHFGLTLAIDVVRVLERCQHFIS